MNTKMYTIMQEDFEGNQTALLICRDKSQADKEIKSLEAGDKYSKYFRVTNSYKG